MKTHGSGGAMLASVLAATIAACAHDEGRKAEAPRTAEGDRARQAEKRAQESERELTQARQRLDASIQETVKARQAQRQAREAVTQAEQAGAQAQQKVWQEEGNVHRLEATAQQHREEAFQAAVQAHIAAEEAQGLQAAQGRLAEASAKRVVVRLDDGRTMSFQIDPRTRVFVGAQERSVADLQQGADARVAYDPKAAERAAVSILVTPARGVVSQQPAQATPAK